MRRLSAYCVLLIAMFTTLPVFAVTCTATNLRGMTWTFTNWNGAIASSNAWSACKSVSASCQVSCGPTYGPGPVAGSVRAVCTAQGQAGIVVTNGVGFGPTPAIARSNAISRAIYNCQANNGVNCSWVPGSCRFS